MLSELIIECEIGFFFHSAELSKQLEIPVVVKIVPFLLNSSPRVSFSSFSSYMLSMFSDIFY